MKELSVNYPKTEEDEAKITKYIQLYKETCEPKILNEIRENKIEDLKISNIQQGQASLKVQFKQLVLRYLIFMKREPAALRARIFNSTFTSLLMLSIYYGVNDPFDVTDLQNIAGYGFILILQQLFFWTLGTVLIF